MLCLSGFEQYSRWVPLNNEAKGPRKAQNKLLCLKKFFYLIAAFAYLNLQAPLPIYLIKKLHSHCNNLFIELNSSISYIIVS